MVMAPGGNLGGGPGSLPPANLPAQPPSILNNVTGPLTIQGGAIQASPNTNLALISGSGSTSVGIYGGPVTLNSGGITFGNDNAWDIGASGANRPRTVYVGTGGIQVAGGSVISSYLIVGQLVFNNNNNVLNGGNGVPAAGLGGNGDFYFRSDTPGTANQRIYVKSAGAWVGIV